MRHFILSVICLLLLQKGIQAQCLSGDCQNGEGVFYDTTDMNFRMTMYIGHFKKGKPAFPRQQFTFSRMYADFQVSRFDVKKYNDTNNYHIYSGQYKYGNNAYSRDGDPYNKSAELECGYLKYEGAMLNKYPNGKGKLTYDAPRDFYELNRRAPTLDYYEGDFLNGSPDGNGVMHYTNGHQEPVIFKDGILIEPYRPDTTAWHEGCISGNCKDGWGTAQWTHNRIFQYTGLWKDGHPAGFGMIVFMTGEMYLGELDNSGHFQGWGQYYRHPGIEECGYFNNGELDVNVKHLAASELKGGYVFDAVEHYIDFVLHYQSPDPAPIPNLVYGATCPVCNGVGKVITTFPCPHCRGRGTYKTWTYRAYDEKVKEDIHNDGSRTITYLAAGSDIDINKCVWCKGTGKEFVRCQSCYGTGKNH